MTDIDIPVSTVRLGADVEESVLAVIRSGTIAQGPVVAALEAGFSRLCDVPHALAVNSGTTALVLALQALGVGPGDEVLTSPFTFAATLNAIIETGATATFVDIDDTYTVDPTLLAAAINPNTRVIMPVHLYGQPADMEAITAAAAHGIAVVEDAAQAHGARFAGRPVGSFGIGCFSLYATKNMTSGEGGIVTTSDDELAERMRILRNQGMQQRYQYVLAGHNYRLTDLQAAVAVPQLATLAAQTERRRANAARLSEGLAQLEGIILPRTAPGRTHVWHQYTVRVTEACRVDRDGLAAGLAERGVGTGVYYPRVVFDYDCYRNHRAVRTAEVPNAARAARQVLSLPVHPHLTDDHLDRIIAAVKEVAGA